MPAPKFLLLAAMAQEREPFLEAADDITGERPGPTEGSLLTEIVLDGVPGKILTTGIGPVNAAAALTGLLAAVPAPAQILSVGSAGGLHENIAVGDVVIGTELRYADVDARAFGYAFGQVPGMPESYAAPAPPARITVAEYVTPGLLVTSSSFVTAELAAAIRAHLPSALAVDMESAALAQTCHVHGINSFTSVRGISDLCSPRAGEEFHDGLGLAARRSAEITRTLITQR